MYTNPNKNMVQFINMVRSNQNPQAFVTNILKERAGQNPVLGNLANLVEAGKTSEVEQVVRNIAKERGIDFDKEYINTKAYWRKYLKQHNGLKIKDLENILRLPTKDNFSQKILKIFCSEKKTIEYQQLKCLYFLFKYNPQVISNQDFRNRLYKLKKKFIAESEKFN